MNARNIKWAFYIVNLETNSLVSRHRHIRGANHKLRYLHSKTSGIYAIRPFNKAQP